MTNHDNLFRGTDFVVGTQDPADVLIQFASRFGASSVFHAFGTAGPEPAALTDIAGRLMTAKLDGIILLSAAGAERLLEQASTLVDPERFFAAIADSRMIVAGPNAARVLARKKIDSNRVLDEASDWRAALNQIASLPELANSRLAIESTILDLPLRSGLEARGTVVEPLSLVAPPVRQNQAAENPLPCIAAIVCDLDGLAGVIQWLNDSGVVDLVRPILFAPSLEIVESAGLLGVDSRHLATNLPPGQWGTVEALQIAGQLW